MIFYGEIPKHSIHKKLLELINKFSKVVVNTQKSITYLYTNNEQFEKEIKKIICKSIRKNKMLKS